jgi:hypothetical protein
MWKERYHNDIVNVQLFFLNRIVNVQLFFLNRIPEFSSARWPTKILPMFSSAVLADENIALFLSVADENKAIFVYFVPSADRRK